MRAAWVAVLCLGAGAPCFASAQEARPDTALPAPELRLRLPLEIGQGALFDHGRKGAEWVGRVSFLPGVSFGELELNASIGAAYTNPEGDLLLGGRASFTVLSFFQQTLGVRLAVESVYMVRAEHARVAAGLQPDAAGLLRLGLWGGRDFQKRSYFFLITIGTDITTWGDPIGAVIEAGPMEDDGEDEGDD